MFERLADLQKTGQVTDEHIRAMRQAGEAVQDVGNLDPALQEAGQAGVWLRGKLASFGPEAQKLGIDVENLNDGVVEYLARYHHPEKWGGMLKELKASLRSKSDLFNKGRLDFLKGVEGGTEQINDLFKMPELWDAPTADVAANYIDGAVSGLRDGQSEQIARWVRGQDRLKYQTPIADAAGNVSGWKPTGAKFFNADPITDAIVRTNRHAKQISQGNFIQEMLKRSAVPEHKVPAGENWPTVSQLFDQAGMKTWASETGAHGAEVELADRMGVMPPEIGNRGAVLGGQPRTVPTIEGVGNLHVPPEIAQDVLRVSSTWKSPEELRGILQVADNLQSLWKATGTQIWPAFHARNILSGLFYNVASGASGDPGQMFKTLKSSYGLLQGKELDPELLKALGVSKTPDLIAELRATGALKPGNSLAYDRDVAQGATQSGILGVAPAAPRTAVQGVKQAIGDAVSSVKDATGKVGKGTAAVDAVIELGQKAGSFGEDLLRVNQFLGRRLQGWTPEAAGLDVKRWLFDFSELTPFEKNVMRRAIPFYSWMRHNTPLVFGELAKNPGGLIGKTLMLGNEVKRDQSYIPDHVAETTAIPLPAPGSFITGFSLPHESAFQNFQPEPTMTKTLRRTGESFLSNFTPPLVAGYSLLTGREPYLGKPLSEVPGPTDNEAIDALLSKFAGRPFNTGRKLLDERHGPVAKVADLLTGVKVVEPPAAGLQRQKENAANRILKDQLDEAPGVRQFSRFYVPPEAQAVLDEEDRAKLRLHNTLVERQRDAAKARRGPSPFAITR